MRVRRGFQVVAFLCAFLQATYPCYGVPIPAGEEVGNRVGILRLGLMDSDIKERAYRVLEKRLQRWLENSREQVFKVTSLAESMDHQQSRRELDKMRLHLFSGKLVARLTDETAGSDEGISEMGDEIDRLLRSLRTDLEYGPQLQEGYVAQALLYCRRGRTNDCQRRLEEAVALGPDADFKEAVPWDLESSPSAAVFLEVLRSVQARARRSCSMSLEVEPAGAELLLNGFSLGRKTAAMRLVLVPGTRYRLSVSASHFEAKVQDIECDRTGHQSLAIHLSPERPGLAKHARDLQYISEKHGVQSLLLVESIADQFNLYLYTPGFSVDPVPLREPLKITKVLGEGADGPVPVSWDDFISLFEKQRSAPLKLAQASSDVIAASASQLWKTSTLEGGGDGREKWYNKPTFWVIAGTLVIGGLAAYLAGRGHTVKTQGGGISVKFE